MDEAIEDLDPREAIVRLEERIAALEQQIDGCRKFEIVARLAVALGGALLLGLMVGAVPFDPLALLGAVVAALGGIVLLGSNSSTRKLAEAQRIAAEAERTALIGMIETRVVNEAPTLH